MVSIVSHYGVKGQKWGVTRVRNTIVRRRKNKIDKKQASVLATNNVMSTKLSKADKAKTAAGKVFSNKIVQAVAVGAALGLGGAMIDSAFSSGSGNWTFEPNASRSPFSGGNSDGLRDATAVAKNIRTLKLGPGG